MAVKTTLEQLEEVQAAISKVMKGQDVTIAGMRWSMADLEALKRREEQLLKRYKTETGTGSPAVNTGIMRRD
ncbi:MAG: hypothetical protein PVI06_17480 [Desulfobacterales bacterium]|jgi:hypothetical protein